MVSKELIQSLYIEQKKSQQEIGLLLNLSQTQIGRYCKKFGIDCSRKGIPTWNKGGTMSEDWKCKIGFANRGLRTSQLKICGICKKSFIARFSKLKIGRGNFCSKICLGKARTGENHPRWIEDRSKLVQRQERNDYAYKEWRRVVRNRDNWKCKIADKNCDGKLVAHHILPWSKFPEKRYEVNNGITLCHFHHPHKRNDEMKLSSLFQSLIDN